ncbi:MULTISPECIES: hypothetical protein [Aerosakkonema]|uniref:hypothetical protein n=1 Tax=Aerosakkonema TaxID=1246629 RepID=UPI0035B7B991
MLKKVTILSLAMIGFSTVPVSADGLFSTSNLKIGDVNISINNEGKVLTKTEASTGKWLGEQKFGQFYGMMWVPEHNVLFVAGVLEGGNRPVLVKIKSTGGGGRNMFGVKPDGGSVSGYNYRLGSQFVQVKNMSYNGSLQVDNGSGVVYRIAGVGGGGYNMFALVNETTCQSLPNYNYFKGCSYY